MIYERKEDSTQTAKSVARELIPFVTFDLASVDRVI